MSCPHCGRMLESSKLEFCPSCLGTLVNASLNPSPVLPVEDPSPPLAQPQPEIPAQPCRLHPDRPVGGTCSRCGLFVCISCDPDLATTSKPLCEACRGREALPPPDGLPIGGWLVLPAIHIVAIVLVNATRLISTAKELFDLRDSGVDALSAEYGVLIGVDLLAMLGFVGYGSFVAYRFWNHHRTVPILMVILYAANLLVSIAGIVLASSVKDAAPESDDMGQAVRVVITSTIWIPYFLLSKRVRATFVAD